MIVWVMNNLDQVILDLIKNKIDSSRMFEQSLKKKIGMFYESMGWEAVVDQQQSIERFF